MMGRLRRSGVTAVGAVAGLLWCLADRAEAHPSLGGTWVSPLPDRTSMILEFAPGLYLGSGIWRGPFTLVVSGCPTSIGEYELLMYTGTQGVLSIREGATAPGWRVGTVDFAAPEVMYLGANYRRPQRK